MDAYSTRERMLELLPSAECDIWHGRERISFDFEGCRAWVVPPSREAADGRPWTWTMQWADAFVERTGVLDLVDRGWHHVTIDTFKHRMDAEGLRVSRDFQHWLVEALGLAPKARLVGMSWGGFFSVRYAAAYPECVSRIYLDAPLLTFNSFSWIAPEADYEAVYSKIGPWAGRRPEGGDWNGDPEMPLNRLDALIAARIPILLLYGGQDQTVPPAMNCEALRARYRAAGLEGTLLRVDRRDLFGHHPHGLDPGDTGEITGFLAGD